ncbi:MAG: RlmE family RNA methyltransferase [Burkholderiales bacterium]
MGRNKTSKAWMHMHVTDPFVRQAQKDGYRSRAVYKLAEIAEKDRLVKPGLVVVDLGAAPGGWSQWLVKQVGTGGRVIAIDCLPMKPIVQAEFIQGDFTSDEGLQSLQQLLKGARADLVLSDMAPNISGVESVDQARCAHLAELAIEFAKAHLKPGGAFLVKVFQGEHFEAVRRQMLATFKTAGVRKPKASRSESKETYLVGRGLRQEEATKIS